MIDLYSDTVSRPTATMRQAMAMAEVGDEQRDEDPTTTALQQRVADLLGTEASLFLPSATMGNAIACRLHTEPGQAVILEASCHLLNSEGGGLAVHAHLVPRIIIGNRGRFSPDAVVERLTGPGYYRPQTTLLCCEQTHNNGGGSVWELEQLRAVCTVARQAGLRTHLDGSRLLNAVVATGVTAAEYCAPFDTVVLCLSKGLGCPVGALLAGSGDAVARARRLKQQFGGAMRQSGILAAAGLYALDHHVARLADDHAHACLLADGLDRLPTVRVERPVESNMVFVDIRATGLTSAQATALFRAKGLRASQPGPYRLRFVTHLDITAADIDRAVEIVHEALGEARPAPAAVGERS